MQRSGIKLPAKALVSSEYFELDVFTVSVSMDSARDPGLSKVQDLETSSSSRRTCYYILLDIVKCLIVAIASSTFLSLV